MPSYVTTSLQINDNRGTITLHGMKRFYKRWLADSLLDLMNVDDAEYDERTGHISVSNEASPIDEESLKRDIVMLCEELELKVQFHIQGLNFFMVLDYAVLLRRETRQYFFYAHGMRLVPNGDFGLRQGSVGAHGMRLVPNGDFGLRQGSVGAHGMRLVPNGTLK